MILVRGEERSSRACLSLSLIPDSSAAMCATHHEHLGAAATSMGVTAGCLPTKTAAITTSDQTRAKAGMNALARCFQMRAAQHDKAADWSPLLSLTESLP